MIERIREEARQAFAELGYPTKQNEDWRFTSVAPIARTTFIPSAALVSLAGSVPKGVQVSKLSEAPEELVEPHLARYADYRSQAFVALNTANFQDGIFIHIPKGAVVEAPIELIFRSSGNGRPTASYPRILIVAEEASQATIIETYTGQVAHAPTLVNPVTEVVAADASVIDHYRLQTEGIRAYHISHLQVQLGRGTNFRSHSLILGGGLVRNDVNSVLSEGTECTLNGLYLADGEQHIDNHTSIDHAKPHGTSHELYKGILAGHSSAVFNGKILVRKDAQKTDAKQTNKNLVLSEEAVINTKPELQIHADDVRCTHGATIGQLDAEGLFYLQSRGIGKEEARRLLILAFARDIVDRIRPETLRRALETLLLEKLHGTRS